MHTRIRTARTVLAALLSTLAACTASSAPVEGPRPAAGDARACRAEPAPSALPAAEALVDAQALGSEATRLWQGSGAPRGHVLFTLLYDREGTNVRRDVIEHSVTDAVADSLQRLVFAHVKRAGPARGEWGVRFRVELGEEPEFAVARRELCTPVHRADRLAMGGPGVDRAPGSMAANRDLVWVRVKLDATGLVTDARVERGALLDVSEARLLTHVRTMAFLPALADGRPVAGETTVPVRLGM